MKKNIIDTFKKIPAQYLLLAMIVCVGIFFRTYHFQDWLVFNPDQARDAALVRDMLAGKTWPLLGPQAGNTAFKLGPIFYYFEYVSAKIFGNAPYVLAYPDLIFSILTLPLLYFFLKKYFDRNLSLALTFLYSASFFVISYSRFAFNPNSIQFFALLLLYALSEILDGEKKENLKWAAAVGIALGVGVQLHALLLVLAPAVAALVFVYLFFRKRFVWKSLLVVVAFTLILNAPQIASETHTGWKNTRAFFKGTNKDADVSTGSLSKEISDDAYCHVQGYVYIISAHGGGDKCDMMKLPNRLAKGKITLMSAPMFVAVSGAVFLFGGFMLLIWYLVRESDRKKKQLLALATLYIAMSFLIFIPVSSGISIRYFVVEIMAPFLLAGVWMKFLGSFFGKRFAVLAIFIVAGILFCANMIALERTASALAKGSASNATTAILGEMTPMVKYVADNIGSGQKKIYFTGKKEYEKRFAEPLSYLFEEQGIKLMELRNKKNNPDPGIPIFYVTKSSPKKYQQGDLLKGYAIESYRKFQSVELFKIEFLIK